MRTTIRMNSELARRAKKLAREHDQSFTEVIEAAVAEYLRSQSLPKPRKPVALPVAGDPHHKLSAADFRRAVETADLEFDLKKAGDAHAGARR